MVHSYGVELIVIGYGGTESINYFKKELGKQVEEKYIENHHRWRRRKFLNHRWWVEWRAILLLSLPILSTFPLSSSTDRC